MSVPELSEETPTTRPTETERETGSLERYVSPSFFPSSLLYPTSSPCLLRQREVVRTHTPSRPAVSDRVHGRTTTRVFHLRKHTCPSHRADPGKSEGTLDRMFKSIWSPGVPADRLASTNLWRESSRAGWVETWSSEGLYLFGSGDPSTVLDRRTVLGPQPPRGVSGRKSHLSPRINTTPSLL